MADDARPPDARRSGAGSSRFGRNYHAFLSFGIATVGVIVAGLSHWWLVPLIGDTPPVRLMLVVTVTASAWLGGLGPGLYATVLGLGVIIVANDAPGDWASLGSRLFRFGSLALLITFLFEGLHAARRRAEAKEQAYRRSEGRFLRLVETASEGIWAIDDAGQVTYANPRLGEMLGIDPARLVGRPMQEFLAATADDPTGRLHDVNGPSAWREVQLRGEDATAPHALVTSRSIGPDEVPGDGLIPSQGAPGGVLFMATDITPLKRAEEALRENESVLHSFYESSSMAMGVVELTSDDARFVSANALADRLFGLPPGQLVGKTATDLASSLEGLSLWIEQIRACRETSRPVRFESRGFRSTGPQWVAVTLSPMGPACSGRALCSLIVEDVTDRKRTQEDLLIAKEAAERANRSKDRFLAVLSHELRTPLTPVLIAVESLLESNLAPELCPALEMMRRNIELESRLIDDLLDLSRIARGRLRFDLEVVDVHEGIRRAVEICRDETFVTGLEVVTALEAQHHHVKADHARVMQIAWNLIRNAAKFTPPNGRLFIRTANPGGPAVLPGSSGERGAPRLVVEFEDTGIGIDSEVLPRIFDPFEPGHDDVRGRHTGLGLGLGISRSLAEAMGGRLTASSPGPGRGSMFRLELSTIASGNAHPAGKPVPGAAVSPAVAPGSEKLHILLVEDNRDTLRFLETVLRQRGHVVVTADRFAIAQAALRETRIPFDLLLSDIELPDGNGLDLMRELAARGTTPGIAMSGFGADEDLRLSREAGFVAHLTKPIDLKRLHQTIHNATIKQADLATATRGGFGQEAGKSATGGDPLR